MKRERLEKETDVSESVSFHVAHVITELQWSGKRTRA